MHVMMALNQVVRGVRREDGPSNKRHNATPQQGFLYVYGGVRWTHLISSIVATPWYIELALINYSLVTTSNGIIRTSNTSEGQTPGPNRIKHIRKKKRNAREKSVTTAVHLSVYMSVYL